MLKRIIPFVLAFGLAGCGAAAQKDGPKDGGKVAAGNVGADGGATATGTKVVEGSKVCVSELLGVRYAVEDLLEKAGLEVTGDCMFADVEIAEHGEPGEYELKYRAIGEAWQSCKSTAKDRTAFVQECMDAIITSGGGAAPKKSDGDT